MQMSFRNPPMLTLQEIMSPVQTESQVITQKMYPNLISSKFIPSKNDLQITRWWFNKTSKIATLIDRKTELKTLEK